MMDVMIDGVLDVRMDGMMDGRMDGMHDGCTKTIALIYCPLHNLNHIGKKFII